MPEVLAGVHITRLEHTALEESGYGVFLKCLKETMSDSY
jgi:hypothetical protein